MSVRRWIETRRPSTGWSRTIAVAGWLRGARERRRVRRRRAAAVVPDWHPQDRKPRAARARSAVSRGLVRPSRWAAGRLQPSARFRTVLCPGMIPTCYIGSHRRPSRSWVAPVVQGLRRMLPTLSRVLFAFTRAGSSLIGAAAVIRQSARPRGDGDRGPHSHHRHSKPTHPVLLLYTRPFFGLKPTRNCTSEQPHAGLLGGR